MQFLEHTLQEYSDERIEREHGPLAEEAQRAFSMFEHSDIRTHNFLLKALSELEEFEYEMALPMTANNYFVQALAKPAI